MASLSFKFLSLFAIIAFHSVITHVVDQSIIDYDKKHGMGGGGAPTTTRTEAEMQMMYEKWLARHGKSYNALGEREKRFEIFKDNVKFVNEHNSVDRTYKVGLNRFSDLTNREYKEKFLGASIARRSAPRSNATTHRYLHKLFDDLPASVDWRAKGAVGPVKDQGQCGKFPFIFSSFV